MSKRCHVCASCGTTFNRGYNISASRAARPQLCSRECRVAWKKALPKQAVDDLFWSKVAKSGPDECWPWRGHRRSLGYGWFNLRGRPTNAHRVAYQLTSGPIPPGMFVCHSCDNPPCCNPAHLWLGTPRANNDDKIRKGRANIRNHRRGADHPKAKLTPDQALEAYHSTEPCSVVAKRFNVTEALIYRIRKGLCWRHTTGAGNAAS